jgi:hypothetical protein
VKDGLMVATGFLALLLGAMPLNGYFLYLCEPGSFHQDAFIGTAWHLLAGVVPFTAGVVLLAFSRASTMQIFLIPLGGVLGGLVLALPAVIKGSDHHAWLACLSIVGVGCVLAVLLHTARSRWHDRALDESGRSGLNRVDC